MFKVLGWAIGLLFSCISFGAAGDPIPVPGTVHFAHRLRLLNTHLTSPRQQLNLKREIREACHRIHRAAFRVSHRWEAILKEYPPGSGVNSGVLRNNREFYRSKLEKIFHRCVSGSFKFQMEKTGGYCSQDNGTEAYVKVWLGGLFLGSTIHLCPLFFRDSGSVGPSEQRVGTVIHEFGRLYGIGDSQKFDTDNIYVWDNIVRLVGEPNHFPPNLYGH